jgi:hypothetical protein
MSCPRCQGLMVPDQFFDLINDEGCWNFQGWRCLCCGNILDSVIIRNQQAAEMEASNNMRCVAEENLDTFAHDSSVLVSLAR